MPSPKRLLAALAGLLGVATAQSLQQTYTQVVRPKLDRAGLVENVAFDWDALHFQLDTGTLALGAPLPGGAATVAVFRGTGHLRVTPPNAIERQQIEFFRGTPAIAESFTEAVFRFASEAQFLAALKQQVLFHPLASEGELGSLLSARAKRLRDFGRWQAVRVLEAQARPGDRLFYAELGTTDRNAVESLLDRLQNADQKWIVASYDPLAAEPDRVGAWHEKPVRELNDHGLRPETMNTVSTNVGSNCPTKFPSEGFFAGFDDTWTQFGHAVGVPAPWRIVSNQLASGNLASGRRVQAAMMVALVSSVQGLLFRLDSTFHITAASVDGQNTSWLQPEQPAWKIDPAQYEGNWVYVALPRRAAVGARLSIRLTFDNAAALPGTQLFAPDNLAWYPLDPFTLAPRDARLSAQINDRGAVIALPGGTLQMALGLSVGMVPPYEYRAAAGDLPVRTTVRKNPPPQELRLAAFKPLGPSAYTLFSQWFGSLAQPELTVASDLAAIERRPELVSNIAARVWSMPAEIAHIPATDDASWPGLVNLDAAFYRVDINPSMIQCQATASTAVLQQIEEVLTAHEVAHQWWGNTVGWSTYHDQWLSEGMASASGVLYQEENFGVKHSLQTLRQWQHDLLHNDYFGHTPNDDGPLWLGRRLDSSVDPLGFDTVVLDKGGYVIYMLRQMLEDANSPQPDARFRALMHDYLATYAHRYPATADFQKVVERHMTPAMNLDGNGSMDWFFQNYVYGTLVPHLIFHSAVAAEAAGQWQITVRVENPDGWRGLLPVYTFQDATHYDRGEMRITGATATAEFTVPFAPTQVIANRFEDMLVQLETPQP